MTSGVRDHVLALACCRLGLPTSHGRGMDRLPSEVTEPLSAALVQRLNAEELRRALNAATHALLAEIRLHDENLAERLDSVLFTLAQALAESANP